MQKDRFAISRVCSTSILSGISTLLFLYAGELILAYWLGNRIRAGRLFYFFLTYMVVGVGLGIGIAAAYTLLIRFGGKIFSPEPARFLPAVGIAIPQVFLCLLILNASLLPVQPIFSVPSLVSSVLIVAFCVASFLVLYRLIRAPDDPFPLWRTLSSCGVMGLVFGILHSLVSREIGRDGVGAPSAVGLSALLLAATTGAVIMEMKLVDAVAKRHGKKGAESGFRKVLFGKAAVAALVLAAIVFATRYKPIVANPDRPQRPRAAADSPNIIFLVLDTVRQDQLSTYGCERRTTPNISKLAEQSWVFDAYSTMSWTLPSHASMVTGKYPTETGTGIEGSYYIDPRNVTLAEILGENGYSTAAIIANAGVLGKSSRFQQGFDYYFARFHETEVPFQMLAPCLLEKFMLNSSANVILFYERAEEINNEALRWVKEQGRRPFFLFINYMDAHDPYVPPPPYNRRWYKGHPPPNLGGGQWLGALLKKMDNKGGGIEAERDYLLSQYDGEIAYLDEQIGIFLEQLKTMGLFDDSLIVLTADHGEFFAEHGLLHHPAVVYQQGLRVPLIIKPPAVSNEAPKRIPGAVSLVNLFRVILHYAGIAHNSGLSVEDLAAASPFIFSEGHLADNLSIRERFGRDLYSLIRGNYKLIYSSDDVYEFYDLSSDPFEAHDLINDALDPQTGRILKQMKTDISLQIDRVNADRLIASALPPDEQEEIRGKLKALGYIQ